MALDLRQSTASQEILLGKFLDETDGITALTALTISNTDIQLRKHGTTVFANKNSGGATHISNGWYHATLDATDTDTAGMLEVVVDEGGALTVLAKYRVLPADVYDALYAPVEEPETPEPEPVVFFTNETSNGYSATEEISGEYMVHIKGVFDGACVKMLVGPSDDIPTTQVFNTSHAVAVSMVVGGNVRFLISGAGDNTSVSVTMEPAS